MKALIKIKLQKIRQIVYIGLYKLFCLLIKQEEDSVLFLSASRSELSGNFEFVYNEINKRKKYKIKTMLKKNLKAKYSLKEKIELSKYLAKSKYIFLDDFYPIIYALKLRKDTELIQLWHAMGAFKTVGYSRMNKEGGPSKHSLTHKNYTGTIVSSENIRKNYAEAFGISIDKVHALGVPRTDIFFDKKYIEKTKNKLYKKYPILKDKKVILFAPTFRGRGQGTAHYNFDWIDLKKFSNELRKDYVCIFKLHPFIKNKPNYDLDNDSFYLDLTSEREINDLLFVTDMLITDYSSVIFEYSFFEKPVVFFTPDLDEYRNNRDFYYPLEDYTYGSVATNFEQLLECIKSSKVDKKKLNKFKKFFCSACDGTSTKKVVNYFLGE